MSHTHARCAGAFNRGVHRDLGGQGAGPDRARVSHGLALFLYGVDDKTDLVVLDHVHNVRTTFVHLVHFRYRQASRGHCRSGAAGRHDGEAGRGFSVVAEEVQRLAERSADATRQISALVRAIQTDTQDAVAAMERSTQGVVEGARLSDSAGTALTEIDSVSRRLADLIQQISSSTSQEADLANEVAGNIQHIFAVTEQTGEGTRATAQQVRELSRMASSRSGPISGFLSFSLSLSLEESDVARSSMVPSGVSR